MFKRVVVISLAVLVLWTCSPSLKSKAQEGETRNLTILDLPKVYEGKEPVKIIGAYLDSKEIESGKDFQAGDNWTKDLNFLVKNVTDQTIKEIILTFDIVEGRPLHEQDSPRTRLQIFWGREYFYSKNPYTKNPERHLGPGQTALIDLGPYREMKGMNPKIVEVYLDAVVFDDTTKAWFLGRYLKREEDGSRWGLDPERAHLNASRYRNQTSRN